MTRIDVVRRTAAVALMCLVGSAIFVRLFGVVPVLTRIWPVIILCCVGYAVGKLVAHFSPFRGQQDMCLTPWGLPGGGGLQLGFNF